MCIHSFKQTQHTHAHTVQAPSQPGQHRTTREEACLQSASPKRVSSIVRARTGLFFFLCAHTLTQGSDRHVLNNHKGSPTKGATRGGEVRGWRKATTYLHSICGSLLLHPIIPSSVEAVWGYTSAR